MQLGITWKIAEYLNEVHNVHIVQTFKMPEQSNHRHSMEGEISSLINAFRYFNEAATTLGAAYRKLEARINDLTNQLDEKDRQLYSRLVELDRVTRYLMSLVESLSSGVVAVDMNGVITIFNRAAAEMLAIPAEGAIGKPYCEIFKCDDRCGAMRTLMEGPELRGVERELPGRALKAAYQTTWVVDSFGERIGVVEVFEDITMLRDLEAKIEHQKTLSALGEMAAAVAHELRNPLSGIGGFAALLKKELAGEPKKLQKVEKIIRGVHTLDRIAGNLLFLTRQKTIRREDVDIRIILSDVAQILESEIANHNSSIKLWLNLPEENVIVSADPELLRLIFTNLGKNAMQAIEPDKFGEVKIQLIWRLLTNRYEVTVDDNGSGISSDNIPKLFNPFFTTKHYGTGLGLALVKKAVELHQGDVAVESVIGAGSRFRVSLPIRHIPTLTDQALQTADNQNPATLPPFVAGEN